MSIVIRKNKDLKVFERLYQLFCYETGEGVMGEDALYTVPDGITAYILEKCGIPCGFAVFSQERCLERLFLLKEHRMAKSENEILTKLFDENVGKWCVSAEHENVVREYTSGDFKREKYLTFDNSKRSKTDGSLTDYNDVLSVVNSYEVNALKHGECVLNKRFADAAKYSARLFTMREKIKEYGLVADVMASLVKKGGNVTVWTAGLALSAGVMADEATEALKAIETESAFYSSAALLLKEYKK